MFAGYYFWWPKLTGRMLDEKLGKIHFWMLFIGFHTTFLIQHWLGVEGMARRYADYLPEEGFQTGQRRLEHRRLPARCLDDPVRLQRVEDVEEGSARRRPTTRGATAPRWSGRRPARRRGTTSRRCRGSAPSVRRSTCTTPRLRPALRPVADQGTLVQVMGPADLEGEHSNGPRRRRQGELTDARRDQALRLPVPLLRARHADLRVLEPVEGADRRHGAGPHRRAVRALRLLLLDDRQEAAASTRRQRQRRDRRAGGQLRLLRRELLDAAVARRFRAPSCSSASRSAGGSSSSVRRSASSPCASGCSSPSRASTPSERTRPRPQHDERPGRRCVRASSL